MRKCAVQKVVESFWLMWHRKYLDSLREIRSCRKVGKVGKGASEIRMGDVAVIEEDVVPRRRWRLGAVVELLSFPHARQGKPKPVCTIECATIFLNVLMRSKLHIAGLYAIQFCLFLPSRLLEFRLHQ